LEYSSIADETEVSKSTVHRHLQRLACSHIDKNIQALKRSIFVRKSTDIVGLYLNPPEIAVVLCVDEKSGISALERTQRCCHWDWVMSKE